MEPVSNSEHLRGALLDCLPHHAQILTMNGESYRLKAYVQKEETMRFSFNRVVLPYLAV